VQMGDVSTAATQRPMANLSRPMEATPRSERRDEPRYDYGLLIRARLRPSLKSGTAEGQSCLGRDVRDQAVSGNALSGVGRGAEGIMRAQAVAATTIAPVIAIACLQLPAGMQMCATNHGGA
jgi:hypothetical protein